MRRIWLSFIRGRCDKSVTFYVIGEKRYNQALAYVTELSLWSLVIHTVGPAIGAMAVFGLIG